MLGGKARQRWCRLASKMKSEYASDYLDYGSVAEDISKSCLTGTGRAGKGCICGDSCNSALRWLSARLKARDVGFHVQVYQMDTKFHRYTKDAERMLVNGRDGGESSVVVPTTYVRTHDVRPIRNHRFNRCWEEIYIVVDSQTSPAAACSPVGIEPPTVKLIFQLSGTRSHYTN